MSTRFSKIGFALLNNYVNDHLHIIRQDNHNICTSYNNLPPLATSNILSQPVPSNLLPLHLLPGDGQLSPQILERALCHLHERTVELLLVVSLRSRNAGDDALSRDRGNGDIDGLVRVESHIAVFIVMHVHKDLAAYGGRLGHGDLVDRAEATVPTARASLAHAFPRSGWHTHQKLFGE